MSRIGKKPMTIPNGVTVAMANGTLTVTGPKGILSRRIPETVTVVQSGTAIQVSVKHETDQFERALWGTTAAHIRNMLTGVVSGFTKQLEVNGVGYKAALQGKDIKLEVGFSHPVIYKMPAAVNATIEKNVITLGSLDKELLGKVAAEIRAIRKPEPYKGKGIKYMDEVIRRKAGKAAKTAA